MTDFVTRPASAFDPGKGLLRAEPFQIAYATNDIDRACDTFSSRYGIAEFRRLEGPRPSGGYIRVELAWVGPVMYELLTASGPGSEFFMAGLPDDFAIRHHHLGFLVRDEAGWTALEGEAERAGRPLQSVSHNAGFMRSGFVHAPELGHYLEYILPEAAGIDFFNGVPGN
jgi:hypothetical protein